MIKPESSGDLENAGKYASDVAIQIFDLSTASKQMQSNPLSGIYKNNIGTSRAGGLNFGSEKGTKILQWYSILGWWSDGQNVLFSISKVDFAKRLRIAREDTKVEPRVFKSRK